MYEVLFMRILLVEDDIKIASFIEKGLKAAGYAIDHAADGDEGLHLALMEPYASGRSFTEITNSCMILQLLELPSSDAGCKRTTACCH